MTLLEMKKRVLQLIEEIDDSEALTSDPDIKAKMNGVINQVMFEVARMKKLPAYIEQPVTKGEVFNLNTIENFYQLRLLRCTNEKGEDAEFEVLENLVIFAEDSTAKIFYYKYPTRITDDTEDAYEFELTQDALEVMPYGVAGDLLKSDVSTEYGSVYSARYESMLQRLDPRYSMNNFSIEGGYSV